MNGVLLLMVALGVGMSYVRRGWLSIPLAVLVPAVPTALGAFDDGEALGHIVIWFALWPALTALGLVAGTIFQRRTTTGPQITP